MKCISGNTGQYLCINRNCQIPNAYICGDPSDNCKENHECCSLISLSYLLKKTRNQPSTVNTDSNNNKRDMLYPLYQKAKSIASTISLALASQKIIKQIHKLLESSEPLSPDDKDKIAKFMNDRKIDNSIQDGLMYRIEKQVEEFQLLITEFYFRMKAIRNFEIEDLRRKLNDQQKQKEPIETKSRLVDPKIYKKQKIVKRKNMDLPLQEPQEVGTPVKLMKQGKSAKEKIYKQMAESEIKKMNSENKISGVDKILDKKEKEKKDKKKNKQENQGRDGRQGKQSNIKKSKNRFKEEEDQPQIREQKMPIIIGSSPQKSRIPQILKSGIKTKQNAHQQKKSSALKNHIPKQPLLSKITNDFQTIRSFFSDKITNAQLLYRASQCQFSTNKFHQKCDGHRNTLTILITEFDKIIGGFTPLPWKMGSGEWYQDQDQVSFLFSLTLGERYPLTCRERAIWCSRNYGPSFGNPDLEIAQKSNINSNSCANFPMCYNNGNYNNTPGSIQLFCGTKSGHFKILQWQVYQLTFA